MLRAENRTLVIGAATFFLLASLGAFTEFLLLRADKAQFIARRMSYLTVVADLKAKSIRDFNHEQLSLLKSYASSATFEMDIRKTLRGDAEARRQVAMIFTGMLADGECSSIALLDRRGRVILAVPPDARPPQLDGPAGAPRFLGVRRNSKGEVVIDYEAGTDEGSRLLLEVKSSEWLTSLIEKWPGLEISAETLLYERYGDSLRAVNNFRYAKNSGLSLTIPLDADIIGARAARGEAGPFQGLDYRGERTLAVVRDLPELRWLLIAKADEEELLAPLYAKNRLIIVASVLVFGLFLAVIVLFLRSQSARLRSEANADRILLSTAIEQAGESIVITDKAGKILYTNPAFSRVAGYTREEAYGKTPAVLKSGRQDRAFYKTLWETVTRGEIWKGRFINRRKDGTLFEEDATITPVRDADGAISHYIAVKRDVSAIKSLEDKLNHSQKMEAIGRLAGGVAHDFNNILTTINGYAEVLSETVPPESQTALDLAEILGAGRRAALLTRQLLTFSRRAPSDPINVDLRAQVRAIEKILRRTLGEDVRLTLDIPDEPLWVRMDPSHIDQIIMNLAVNARDAMPQGGTLTVRSCVTEFESDEILMLDVIPAGRYATLVVMDDGTGMDASVLSRLFEPFFTTKEKGKGTGLGLATVFGIVKQSKGHITVDSAPGRGTTFTIHIPFAAAPPTSSAPGPEPDRTRATSRGDETILVAEDQPEVLRIVTRALTPQGYHVIACGGGAEALKAAKSVPGPIHLLLTDVVMPGMSGEELAVQLRQARPETRVLFMSGYTDGRLDKLGESVGKADLMLKPFTVEQICRRVRDALDGAAPRVG